MCGRRRKIQLPKHAWNALKSIALTKPNTTSPSRISMRQPTKCIGTWNRLTKCHAEPKINRYSKHFAVGEASALQLEKNRHFFRLHIESPKVLSPPRSMLVCEHGLRHHFSSVSPHHFSFFAFFRHTRRIECSTKSVRFFKQDLKRWTCDNKGSKNYEENYWFYKKIQKNICRCRPTIYTHQRRMYQNDSKIVFFPFISLIIFEFWTPFFKKKCFELFWEYCLPCVCVMV